MEVDTNIFFFEITVYRLGWTRYVYLCLHGGLESIWIQTGRTLCTGLSDSRQVPPRPSSMSDWFQLWWRGQTFYSHIGLGSIRIRTEPTLVLVSVMCGKYRPDPISYAGSVSTLLARPDFLQFPAYHRPILPTPLA